MRTDISLQQQLVQSSHAALEAGLKNSNQYQQTSSIIIFQIENENQLIQELEYIQSLGIECAFFYEPYNDIGITAFATLPIGEEQRHYFKKYTLWGRGFKHKNHHLHHYLKEEKKSFQNKNKIEIEQKNIFVYGEQYE